MAFDPDKWLAENSDKPKKPVKRKKKVKTKKFDPDKFLADEEAEKEGGILDAIATAGEYVDRYTGAPTRAAIGAYQEDGDPVEAFSSQFGEPSALAPTGADIAARAGFSEEVPEAGTVMRKGIEYPLEGISPARAAGGVVEAFADPLAAVSTGISATGKALRSIKPIRIGLKTRASRKAFKSLAQRASVGDVGKALGRSRQEIIGGSLLDEDLGKYLNDPVRMIEKINGRKFTDYDQIRRGGKTFDRPIKKSESGLISEISNETTDIINKIDSSADKTNVSGMMEEMLESDIGRRINPESAAKLSSKDIKKYEKLLNQYLKPAGPDDVRSLSQLQNLKKDLGKRLSSDEFFKPQDKSKAFEKVVVQDVYHGLKRKIEGAVEGIPVDVDGQIIDAGEIVGHNNQRISGMMSVNEMLSAIPSKELKSASTSQKIVDLLTTGAIGVGTAEVTGSKTAGLAAAGVYGASKVGEKISRALPGAEARAIQGAITGDIPQGVKAAVGAEVGARMFSQPDVGREPQSIATELVRTKISRNTDEILANQDLLLAKVAQQAPEQFDMIQDILTHEPEKLKELVPVLAQMAPHLFADDKYGRIDGVILDPVKKEMAREDMMMNEDLSNVEKMLKMNNLNKTGVYND